MALRPLSACVLDLAPRFSKSRLPRQTRLNAWARHDSLQRALHMAAQENAPRCGRDGLAQQRREACLPSRDMFGAATSVGAWCIWWASKGRQVYTSCAVAAAAELRRRSNEREIAVTAGPAWRWPPARGGLRPVPQKKSMSMLGCGRSPSSSVRITFSSSFTPTSVTDDSGYLRHAAQAGRRAPASSKGQAHHQRRSHSVLA